MIKKAFTAAAVAGSAFLFAIAGTAPAMANDEDNLVQNGQFDQSQFWKDNGRWYEGENLGVWSINASSGTVPGIPTAIVWHDSMTGDGAVMAAPFSYGPWIRVMGSISQTLATEAGTTYTLTYDSRASGSDANDLAVGWAGGNTSRVLIDGVVVDTFETVTSPRYSTRTVTFTATSNSTLLTLANAGGGAVGFDRVTVFAVPVDDSPLMVPAIASGLGVAALAAGGVAIARRARAGESQ